MTTLRLGSRGPEVAALQRKLALAGYDPGAPDGDYGAGTAAAVLAFQSDRPDIEDDKIAGPATLAALETAIRHLPVDPVEPPIVCDAATWQAVLELVRRVIAIVKYGPGRGLYSDGKFVITYGAGRIGGTVEQWPNHLGKTYPAFHCSSWTNFFLSWLLRRNELFTHAGNFDLFKTLEGSRDVHQQPGVGAWRGFREDAAPIEPDGTGVARSGFRGTLDARELLARRETLPTFIVCGQSTKRGGSWNLWHHTVLFVVDHRDGHRLYRIAADGYKDARGYSAQAMHWIEITAANVGQLDGAVYRAWGVTPNADGTYGDVSKPIAAVEFES